MVAYQEEKGLAYESASVAPFTEAIGAIAIIVLAILGLAHIVPESMMSVAAIVAGGTLLLQGGNTFSEYAQHVMKGAGDASGRAHLGGGITIEFLAGGIGIVLGILSLLAEDSAILVPAALVVFGGALLLSGSVTVRASLVGSAVTPTSAAVQQIAEEASAVASGAQALIGLGAMVLGVLALVSIHPTVISLVGLLAIGASLLVTSAAVGGALVNLLRS